MNVIFTIAMRNLIRQKRRNILLGIAIAFGAMILIVAHSFSHGISDVLFNRVVSYVAGHVSITYVQGGMVRNPVFHDGDRLKEIIKKNVGDLVSFQEAIGVFTRAIGNGRADNIVLIGVNLKADIDSASRAKSKKEYLDNFKPVVGHIEDIDDTTLENPVMVSQQKAAYLNIKKGDVLRARFQNIYGQNQAARLTIVGIFKPANMFMETPVFMSIRNLRRLNGYAPHDIGQLYITLKDPKKSAIKTADKMQELLQPASAAIPGTVTAKAGAINAVAFGFRTDSLSLVELAKAIDITNGSAAVAISKNGVLIGKALADSLRLAAGDTCMLVYRGKYDSVDVQVQLAVNGIFTGKNTVDQGIVLINEKTFFKTYYEHWPINDGKKLSAEKGLGGLSFVSTEWNLMKRCKTTQEVQKAFRNVAKHKSAAVTLSVQSMYESASAILNLESALNLITVAAVLVLFFIILIGVINTLRMTIRERTREIGTVRAIGMQRNDVRNAFLLETMFLSLFSSAAGTGLAFIIMGLLSAMKINLVDNPLGMLLVNGHLNFAPTIIGVAGFIVMILLITVITAYFPARRAAKLSAAAALRHYE